MQFLIDRDNGAECHRRLIDDDSRRLAVSAVTCNSAEDARRTTAEAHERAGTTAGTEG